MEKSILILFFAAVFSPAFAVDIYVSPSGNDQHAGTKDAPVATPGRAIRLAREMRRLNAPGIENGIQIILKDGLYSLYETINLRPEDSGTAVSPTIIRSEKTTMDATGELQPGAIISGGVQVKNWKKSGKLMIAQVPEFNGRPLEIRQLWINGKKAVRSRDIQDFAQMNRILRNDKVNQILWVPAKAVRKIIKSPYAEMVLHQMWAVSFLRIKSVEIHGDSAAVRFHNPESRLQFERPWPQPMIGNGVNSPFYLTNAIELLDSPGEWYHDIRTNQLYYYPLPGEQVANAIVPAIETLIAVEGTTDRQVKHVYFQHLNFSYAAWKRPSQSGHVPLQAGMYLTEGYKLNPQIIRINNHKLDNQGWLGRPVAAVKVSGAEDISFEGCVFKHLAATGLDYVSGTNRGKVENCIFTDIAGNGLVAGSFSPSSLETHLPYLPADTREVCTGLEIHRNLFRDVTNEDWGCVGIAAGYVSGIKITHNEICEVSYTGISLGWGWNRDVQMMKNNRVINNHIHHYARHLYDVAGIYTLGAQPGTIITENYVHSIYHPAYVHDPNHWFYLYTDEGSSYIQLINNKTEGDKFLQNANGPGNVWQNNGPMVHDSVAVKAGRK